MKQKIVDALKRQYAHAGLGGDLIDGMADIVLGNVKEESEIDTAVSSCAPLVAKLQSSLDSLRDARSRAEQRVKELEKSLNERPIEPKSDQKPQTEEAVTASQDDNNPLASLLDTVKRLQSQVDGLKAEKTQKTLMEQLSGALKERKVPESYYDAVLRGRTLAADLDVSAYVDDIAQSYESLQKALSEERFSGVEPPEKGMSGVDETDPLARLIEKGTKEILEADKK